MSSPLGDALIFGCGYLGTRVLELWQPRRKVYVVTRSRAEEFAARGALPIVADVLSPESLDNLPKVEVVLYAVASDRNSAIPMQTLYVEGVRHLLQSPLFQKSVRPRFLYVSSTSVYSQTGGVIVDENSPAAPVEGSGQVVLAAEEVVRELCPEATILRFAGIYGPGRFLRREKQFRDQEPIDGNPDRTLNLIHVEDGARAVVAAESRGAVGQTYLIADNEPPSRRSFYQELAQVLNLPEPVFSHTESSERASDRRISNAKARRELDWQPLYPSYREGLRASLPKVSFHSAELP